VRVFVDPVRRAVVRGAGPGRHGRVVDHGRAVTVGQREPCTADVVAAERITDVGPDVDHVTRIPGILYVHRRIDRRMGGDLVDVDDRAGLEIEAAVVRGALP